MKLRWFFASLTLLPVHFAAAQPVSCQTHDSNCFKRELNELANLNKENHSYHRARELLFQLVDARRDDRGFKFVECVYSHKIFRYATPGIPDNGVNTEHTFPQSRLKRYPRFDESKSDLYHLFPTEIGINSMRGNLPFAELDSGERTGDSLRLNGQGFEPPEEHKGRVARAIFYISTTYNIPVENREEEVLRDWNKQFPVDDYEAERSDRVKEAQGNENPFVLDPELVDRIKDF